MPPDVNVLVAASRSDHPHHKTALAWLAGAITDAESGAALTQMPMVLASLLRLVSSPKIFKTPAPMAEAVAFVDAVLAAPGVQLGTLGPEWPLFRQQCLDGKLAANAVPDAWLAAAVQHSGEHLMSFDKDFKKLLGRARFTHLVT